MIPLSARQMPTDAESRLWLLLRNRRFAAYKFRRQVPIGSYIADFVCYSAMLIIEADGSQHAQNARDDKRDAELRRRGFHLLRFWNDDVLRDIDNVCRHIVIAAGLTVENAARQAAAAFEFGEDHA